MNLQKLQELENLKEQLGNKGKIITDLFMKKKKEYLFQAQSDFEQFFKNQNFKVTKTNNILNAVCGGSIITLEIPKLEDNFAGAYSVFDFSINISNVKNEKYIISLNRMGSHPVITSTISSVPKNESEDQKLQKEIDKTNQSLIDMENNIKSISDEKWGFLLRQEKQSFNECKQFSSITELLQSFFQ